MKNRLFQWTLLLASIAGIAIISFAALQTQPSAQRYKLTLENGKIIEGEIVGVTTTIISIKTDSSGVIVLDREKILKIELLKEEPKLKQMLPRQQQSPTQIYKLTLESGKIIEGEIVEVTSTHISIKDASVGLVVIARENILKIEPPLDEAKLTAKTLPPPPPVPTPTYAEQPYVPRASNGSKIKIGFILSGGMSNIDGGDFNKMIRDQNMYYEDSDDYWRDDPGYTVDWKEMKWMTNFKVEAFARIGKYFGLGLGVEYMKKSNPGTIRYDYYDASRSTYSYYYVDYTDLWTISEQYDQSLTVIPLTLNLYGYLPLGDNFEAFVNLGPGLYLGSHTTDYKYTDFTETYWDYRYSNGTPYPPNYSITSEWEETQHFEATCNTIGVHLGAGFNYRLGSKIALFGEAFCRMAKFDDWEGSAHRIWKGTLTSGWVGDQTITKYLGDTVWTGKIYYGEYYNANFKNKYYGDYWLSEKLPDDSSYAKNHRLAEFNVNGFSFRAGIKIFFTLGAGR